MFDGDAGEAVQRYLGGGADHRRAAVVEGPELETRTRRRGSTAMLRAFVCRAHAVRDERGQAASSFRSDEQITIAVDFTVLRHLPSFRVLVTLTDANQVPVLRTETIDDEHPHSTRSSRVTTARPSCFRATSSVMSG